MRRSRAESEAYWRRLIGELQQSGQTIRGFCREQGLTESAFHFWKRELGGATLRIEAGVDAAEFLAAAFE